MNDIDYINLGAITQEKKQSDFNLTKMGSGTPIPLSYRPDYTGVIYHQRKTPSCGAHAGVYVKNIQECRNHSPAYLWKRIKQIDGIPPENGTSMEFIFKALQKYGVCELSLLDNDTMLNLDTYTDSSTITPKMDLNALQSRIGAYGYDWKPTFESIKQAIYEHGVVLIRVEISADFWTPSWNGKDILPLHTKFKGQGGHFMVLNGYDEKYIYGLNEWSEAWGDKGTFYFDESYMPRVTYIGTCVDLVDKAPYIFTRTIKRGMTGTDVGTLQVILRDKGFFPKTQSITKLFGVITEKAVREFQVTQGLTSDGIVGKLTQKALIK